MKKIILPNSKIKLLLRTCHLALVSRNKSTNVVFEPKIGEKIYLDLKPNSKHIYQVQYT